MKIADSCHKEESVVVFKRDPETTVILVPEPLNLSYREIIPEW